MELLVKDTFAACMIWSCFWLTDVWAADWRRVFPSQSVSSTRFLDYHVVQSAFLHHPMQFVKYSGHKRCLPNNFLILSVKRKCLHYRTGFNYVLLSQRLHHNIYLLCSSDSLWEESPCCQYCSVVRCLFTPSLRRHEMSSQDRGCILRCPMTCLWNTRIKPVFLRALANPQSTLSRLSSLN